MEIYAFAPSEIKKELSVVKAAIRRQYQWNDTEMKDIGEICQFMIPKTNQNTNHVYISWDVPFAVNVIRHRFPWSSMKMFIFVQFNPKTWNISSTYYG